MVVNYKGQNFITDNDLKVSVLGVWPLWKIKNNELRKIFQNKYGRDFLGGDEIISYAQPLVASKMDFNSLENEILDDINDSEKPDLKEIIFKKTATGIGRGHSLGGLTGVVLGIHGTKMIDSGLTGLVASRSLVTSARRKETTTEEIVIPESLLRRQDLLDEYLEISRDVLQCSENFKEKFGKLGGIETFNKITPYNGPADLFIVLPLDTLATLNFEVREDELNLNGSFMPRELYKLIGMLPEITKETGINIMFSQRTEVPRDAYLHYTVFKDPELPNYALELAELRGMPTEPIVVDCSKDITEGFRKSIDKLKEKFEYAAQTDEPEKLADASMECMLTMRNFVGDYNEAVRVKILDNLSWRVWSEQKRHATLRQNVESVYSAVDRAYTGIYEMWQIIKEIYEGNTDGELPFDKLNKLIVIDDRLKKHPELATAYVYHTARQLMFYGKLRNNGVEPRDALYIVPRNIRLRTLENYDLINLIDLELPLRMCSTCEPERQATSWKKRDVVVQVVPELDYFLQPKCRIGFCTEGKFCNNITNMRKYNQDLHKETKQIMLNRARDKLD